MRRMKVVLQYDKAETEVRDAPLIERVRRRYCHVRKNYIYINIFKVPLRVPQEERARCTTGTAKRCITHLMP